jgi:RimJ/RimL family protein N-acetyltransferase
MKKCGLIKEGIRRQGDSNNSGISDMVYYGLVRDDWRKQV